MFMESVSCGGAEMMEMDALMMPVDGGAIHFMVEPMVQLMHLMIA